MARTDYYHVENAPAANSIVPAVSAVVHDAQGKIVLQLRADNGYWSLPGGGLEVGESVEQAIIREVIEETGLNVTVQKLIGIYSDPQHVIAYTNGEVRQQFSICFLCSVSETTLTASSESFEVRWFKPAEIDALKIHPANKLRIDDYLTKSANPFIR